MGYPKTLEATMCLIFMALMALTTHSFPPPPPQKPYNNENSGHRDFLAVHNAVRAGVGVGPVAWNETLAAYARGYAAQRAADCAMEHSGGPYGENLAAGSWDMSGEEASKLWADEGAHYDYASNACRGGSQCGHYTQMVWRDSVRLGCARAKCQNGWTFVTCNYDPPGNYYGERPY